jgi:hypothetical protein
LYSEEGQSYSNMNGLRSFGLLRKLQQ